MFIILQKHMKKFCLVIASLLLLWWMFFSGVYAQKENGFAWAESEDPSKWITDSSNPVDLVKKVYRQANDDNWSKVQKTALDNVSSKFCDDIALEGKFTIARTLCNIKFNIKWYLQYIVYIWLAGATIFIIRNWFKLVTATDKEWQMKTFKKNMINLVIWVLLLTCFYFILDVFVSVVNFIAGD